MGLPKNIQPQEQLPISTITLHCDNITDDALNSDNNQFTLSGSDITKFISFIYDEKKEIASIFRADTNPTYKEYMDELYINREINKIYGDDSSTYLTSAPYEYNKLKILGLVVKFNDQKRQPLYVIFGSKCKQIKGAVDIDKFISDLLNSLIVLQKNQYEHSDIKIDNIVLCQENYKLIDWGRGAKISPTLKPLQMGARLSTSPIRWYLNGYPGALITTAISYYTATSSRYKDFAAWSPFQITFKRIYQEFDAQINKYSRAQLYEKFKNTFDVYMLGITILHAVFLKGDNRDHLYYFSYNKIIDALTSLDKPLTAVTALTAIEALALSKI